MPVETLPSGTPAHLARSEGASRGLIVIPDVWGLRPLFTEMCDDLAARTEVAMAATFAGLGFGNAGVHLPHGMGYAIAGVGADIMDAIWQRYLSTMPDWSINWRAR
mgnify:CR=1 FL=1